jgi:hypothetical protein
MILKHKFGISFKLLRVEPARDHHPDVAGNVFICKAYVDGQVVGAEMIFWPSSFEA